MYLYFCTGLHRNLHSYFRFSVALCPLCFCFVEGLSVCACVCGDLSTTSQHRLTNTHVQKPLPSPLNPRLHKQIVVASCHYLRQASSHLSSATICINIPYSCASNISFFFFVYNQNCVCVFRFYTYVCVYTHTHIYI